MSHLHGDPEQMLEFSLALDAWCAETRESVNRLYSRLTNMGAGDWTDENYQRFVESFEPLAASVMVSLAQLDGELVPHLRQLADRYLELRGG